MSSELLEYEQQIQRLAALEGVFRERAQAARTRATQLKARGDVLKARDYERLATAWRKAAAELGGAISVVAWPADSLASAGRACRALVPVER